jgi:aldehyde dehydrogenase (NAD+)
MQAAMTQVPLDDSSDEIRSATRRVFESQQQIALEWRDSTAAERISRVLKLRDAVLANRDSLYEAAYQDFRKPRVEVDLGEIMPVLHSAKSIAKNLAKWMKPQKVGLTMTTLGSSAKVEYQPRGRLLARFED